jgi:hypothetical protein
VTSGSHAPGLSAPGQAAWRRGGAAPEQLTNIFSKRLGSQCLQAVGLRSPSQPPTFAPGM